jgi:hypothetical protein
VLEGIQNKRIINEILFIYGVFRGTIKGMKVIQKRKRDKEFMKK